MIDMKQTVKEITRDQAQKINPLICMSVSDTLHNTYSFIDVMQDYLISNKVVEIDCEGMCIYLRLIQAALDYEAEMDLAGK